MKAVQHDFDFQSLLWISNNASAVHSVIAQKVTSKNTIILFKVQVWIVLDVSLFFPISTNCTCYASTSSQFAYDAHLRSYMYSEFHTGNPSIIFAFE